MEMTIKVNVTDDPGEWKWRSRWTETTIKVSGNDDQSEWKKRPRWMELTIEVSGNDDGDCKWPCRWIKMGRKANGVTMKVLFVVQASSRARGVSGTATTGCVWKRTVCVTATTTVMTEVTSFLRTAPATKTRHELWHSFRLFETEGCAPSQNLWQNSNKVEVSKFNNTPRNKHMTTMIHHHEW